MELIEELLDGYSDNEDNLIIPKKRAVNRSWFKVLEYNTPEEAENYVKNEFTWSKSSSKKNLEGTRVEYRCNKGSYRYNECPSSLYLLYHIDSTRVSIFKTLNEHQHDANDEDNKRGLSQETKMFIKSKFEDGVKKPNAILTLFKMSNLKAPPKKKVNGYLRLLREKKKGSTSVSGAKKINWCEERNIFLKINQAQNGEIQNFEGNDNYEESESSYKEPRVPSNSELEKSNDYETNSIENKDSSLLRIEPKEYVSCRIPRDHEDDVIEIKEEINEEEDEDEVPIEFVDDFDEIKTELTEKNLDEIPISESDHMIKIANLQSESNSRGNDLKKLHSKKIKLDNKNSSAFPASLEPRNSKINPTNEDPPTRHGPTGLRTVSGAYEDEFFYFCMSIAERLRQMPKLNAMKCQLKIHTALLEEEIIIENQH